MIACWLRNLFYRCERGFRIAGWESIGINFDIRPFLWRLDFSADRCRTVFVAGPFSVCVFYKSYRKKMRKDLPGAL